MFFQKKEWQNAQKVLKLPEKSNVQLPVDK